MNDLSKIKHKILHFNNFRIEVQFNPARVRSTAAPLDPGGRPCFLCAENRLPEQEAVRWRDYEILVNPFPIFERHLTIPSAAHTPQFLSGRFADMLALTAELSAHVVTFNGARAGASAPDHFHFQAVPKGALPSQAELPEWENRDTLYNKEVAVWAANETLRPALVIEGTEAAAVANIAERMLAELKNSLQAPDEAQVNALAWSDSGKFTVVIFPRTAHRPREWDAPEPERFLFSPGMAELAGVLVTVRPQDFERACPELLTRLYGQVVPDTTLWKSIKNNIASCLTASPK